MRNQCSDGAHLVGLGELCLSSQSRNGHGGFIKARPSVLAGGCPSYRRVPGQGGRSTRDERAVAWKRTHGLTTLPLLLQLHKGWAVSA